MMGFRIVIILLVVFLLIFVQVVIMRWVLRIDEIVELLEQIRDGIRYKGAQVQREADELRHLTGKEIE